MESEAPPFLSATAPAPAPALPITTTEEEKRYISMSAHHRNSRVKEYIKDEEVNLEIVKPNDDKEEGEPPSIEPLPIDSEPPVCTTIAVVTMTTTTTSTLIEGERNNLKAVDDGFIRSNLDELKKSDPRRVRSISIGARPPKGKPLPLMVMQTDMGLAYDTPPPPSVVVTNSKEKTILAVLEDPSMNTISLDEEQTEHPKTAKEMAELKQLHRQHRIQPTSEDLGAGLLVAKSNCLNESVNDSELPIEGQRKSQVFPKLIDWNVIVKETPEESSSDSDSNEAISVELPLPDNLELWGVPEVCCWLHELGIYHYREK